MPERKRIKWSSKDYRAMACAVATAFSDYIEYVRCNLNSPEKVDMFDSLVRAVPGMSEKACLRSLKSRLFSDSEVIDVPVEDLLLYINAEDLFTRTLVQWRLQQGI